MPRGKYTNHKGRSRRFTSAEELEEQRRQDETFRQKKAEPGMESSDEDEEKSGSSDESGSEGEQKAKGVENLIEVVNPNRMPNKPKKLSEVTEEVTPELSRREMEEIKKHKMRAHYHKLHAQGKTAQAKSDLARLAIIKQQREEAAKRREAEKLEKEAGKQSKVAEMQKVLGKK
ncbi:28 kDa heat- and acid-stable phosphoprotein-like isoform X2 [Cimex lectularius]|uniref:Casein kinase substrate phosphoprotein PP28 domain-containing protein n=1 Tax=Cimex lectularius TaxID=79782 RepID=A0A8I6RJI1_CIMLE|nr:28 kDa heat- and acid-stable phosphoprotein-like isoform X2 [Cimex lectularius]